MIPNPPPELKAFFQAIPAKTGGHASSNLKIPSNNTAMKDFADWLQTSVYRDMKHLVIIYHDLKTVTTKSESVDISVKDFAVFDYVHIGDKLEELMNRVKQNIPRYSRHFYITGFDVHIINRGLTIEISVIIRMGNKDEYTEGTT